MAYEQLYGPLGPVRDEIHAALIASTVANTVSKKTLRTSDFMTDWSEREVVLDGDDP
jgi:hypothetical protein